MSRSISRIKDWSTNDPERLDYVEDSSDIDDDSNEVNTTKIINKTDLDDVIKEVNSMEIKDRASINSAILGSWYSTPRPIQLKTLLKMYGNGSWDSDDNIFSKLIMQRTTEGQVPKKQFYNLFSNDYLTLGRLSLTA